MSSQLPDGTVLAERAPPAHRLLTGIATLALLVSLATPARGQAVRGTRVVDDAAIGFATVAHASILPDGHLVLSLRGGDRRLAIVGLNGAVSLVGRAGQGPGEISGGFPPLIGVTGSNVWVADQMKRLFVVAPDGKHLRDVSWPSDIRDAGGSAKLLSQGLIRTVLPDGDLIVSGTRLPGSTTAAWAGGLTDDTHYALRVSADGRLVRRLVAVASWKCTAAARVQPLYCPKLLDEMSPDGRWLVVIEPTATLGQVRRSIVNTATGEGSISTVTLPAPAISGSAKDSIRNVIAGYSSDPAFVAQARRQAIVDHYPGARALQVANDGSHIVLTSIPGRYATWYRYRADGARTGEILLPHTFTPKVYDGSTVVGVEKDEDGVESVMRYPVVAQ